MKIKARHLDSLLDRWELLGLPCFSVNCQGKFYARVESRFTIIYRERHIREEYHEATNAQRSEALETPATCFRGLPYTERRQDCRKRNTCRNKSASPDTLSNHNQIKDGRGAPPRYLRALMSLVRVGHYFDLVVLSAAHLIDRLCFSLSDSLKYDIRLCFKISQKRYLARDMWASSRTKPE